MDIRQLRAFAKVYERKSFSRAAEDLLLSQPTVSAHIASLEQFMHVTLFDRLGRSILPTQAAEILYNHSVAVFASLDRAESEIRLLSNEVYGELTLGGSTIPSNYLFPDLLSGFLRRYPNVRISLTQGDSMNILERVQSGELLVGVVGAKSATMDLVYQPLVEDSLVVLAAPGSVSCTDSPMQIDSLRKMKWVMRQPGSGTRLAVERALDRAGLPLKELNVVCVVDGTEAQLRFVRSGLGVTVSSRLAAREYLSHNELVVLDIPELYFERSFFVVSHPSRHQFPVVRYFLQYLAESPAALNTVTAVDQNNGSGCLPIE